MPLQTNPKSNQIKMQIPNPKCCMIIIFTNLSIPPNESQIKSNSNANPKSQMLHDHNLYKPKDAAPNESQIKSNSIANDLHNPKDDLYNPKEDLYNPKDAQSQG